MLFLMRLRILLIWSRLLSLILPPRQSVSARIFMEVYSMSRRMSRRPDRRVFRRTAASAKKINISPRIYRGGIRL